MTSSQQNAMVPISAVLDKSVQADPIAFLNFAPTELAVQFQVQIINAMETPANKIQTVQVTIAIKVLVRLLAFRIP